MQICRKLVTTSVATLVELMDLEKTLWEKVKTRRNSSSAHVYIQDCEHTSRNMYVGEVVVSMESLQELFGVKTV